MDKHAASRAGELTEVKLSRDLGLFSITMIGVGAMIGVGIFVLTGIAGHSRRRSGSCLDSLLRPKRHRHSLYGHGLRRAGLGDSGGRRRLLMGQAGIARAQCFPGRMDELARKKQVEEDGLLAPKGRNGSSDLHTSVKQVSLFITGIVAFSSIFLMFCGKGRMLTWIGAIAFFVCLIWFTRLSLKGIVVQVRK